MIELSRLRSVSTHALPGTLPASWAKLTSVKELGLSSNLLTGSVPEDWPKQLNNLKVLDLSGNQQMCGQLQELPGELKVHKTATGLGTQCRMQGRVPTSTAIAAGELYFPAMCCSISLMFGMSCL